MRVEREKISGEEPKMTNTMTPTSFTAPVSQTVTTEKKEQSELEALRKEIAGLQAQVGDSFSKTTEQFSKIDRNTINQAFKKAGDTVKDGANKCGEVIAKNPIKSTVAAGAAGLIIGALIERSGVIDKARDGIGNAAKNAGKAVNNGIQEAKSLPGKHPMATGVLIEAGKIGINAIITNEIVKHQINEALKNKS